MKATKDKENSLRI